MKVLEQNHTDDVPSLDAGDDADNDTPAPKNRSVRQLGAHGTGTSLMEQQTELDTHADTSVVGKESALLIHDYDTPIRVHGYTEEVSHSSNCRIVNAVIAYDHQETGAV